MTTPRTRRALLPAAAATLLAGAAAQGGAASATPPVEFGAVDWLRDFAAAEARAKAGELPLLVLFQEVPG